MFFSKSKDARTSSKLSVFIRTAKSREKKKVYKRVIEEANREQNELIKKHAADKAESLAPTRNQLISKGISD